MKRYRVYYNPGPVIVVNGVHHELVGVPWGKSRCPECSLRKECHEYKAEIAYTLCERWTTISNCEHFEVIKKEEE